MSFEWLLERDWVCTGILKSLVGIWLWMASLGRCHLAVPSSLFQFLDRFFPRVVQWWPSAKREVEVMAALLGSLQLEIRQKAIPWAFAADAEGPNLTDAGGFGVVGRPITEALAQRVFVESTAVAHTVTRLDGSMRQLLRPEKELKGRIPISKVPLPVLAPEDGAWRPLGCGRWRHRDHITLGEGRAGNWLLHRLAAAGTVADCSVFCLCDNLPWVGAAAKGRSPTFRLNRLLRERASLLLATGIRYLHPWIDTARMPADWLSRLK